jgi:hypothetical protein
MAITSPSHRSLYENLTSQQAFELGFSWILHGDTPYDVEVS